MVMAVVAVVMAVLAVVMAVLAVAGGDSGCGDVGVGCSGRR